MMMSYRIIAGLTVLVIAIQALAADAPPAGNDLAAFERFAGEWVVDGKWSDGTPLHARSIYEWGLGKKILKAKTFVMNGDKEYQRYDSVMAWHPEKKSLYEISFAFDGAINEIMIEAKDKDTLHLGWAPVNPDKPSPARQVIQFLDRDHFRWTVTVKNGENWKQLIDATWRRK